MSDYVLPLCLGIGLSAACGFRVFLPMLIASVAARLGWLELTESFAWSASWPAILTLSVASVCEVGGYYLPWLDNALDAIATPLAAVAGVVLLAACLSEFDPLMRWSLAAIAGGSTAGGIKLAWSSIRLGSTATTGGAANPVVSTTEVVGAGLLSLLAIVLPILAAILGIAMLVAAVVCVWRLRKWWVGRSATSSDGAQ